METQVIIFAVIIGISIIAIILTLIIANHKHINCWPFKYGGFKEDNGYNDPRKINKGGKY